MGLEQRQKVIVELDTEALQRKVKLGQLVYRHVSIRLCLSSTLTAAPAPLRVDWL